MTRPTDVLARPLPQDEDRHTGDWDSLLGAVTTRLRQAAGDCPEARVGPANPQRRSRTTTSAARNDGHSTQDLAGQGLRDIALACATALDSLHSDLARAQLQRQRLQQQLDGALALLAAAETLERHATHLALHDSLTALPNRRSLCARLRRELQAAPIGQPGLVLLFIDLDDFKQVNDAHGHAVGDELLRIVAARLKHAVRSEDLVCRPGGDEFVLLLPSRASREQLTRLALQLSEALAAPVQLGAVRVMVHPSIGIAMWPADGHSPQALLASADSAMYRAKRSRSGYAFHEQQALS